MPKLNTTIDNLELKTNRVTATTPSASWTDAQYPSAKALYSAYSSLNTSVGGVSTRCGTLETRCGTIETTCGTLTESYDKLVNIAHPVGSVMITSAKENPSSKVGGGTWTLIDKEFASSHTNNSKYFTPAANVALAGAWVTRNGHTMRVRISITVNATPTDTGMTLGTFDCEAAGIANIPVNYTGLTTHSDAANCGLVWAMTTAGELTMTDVVDASTIPTGNGFNIDFTFPVTQALMLDSFCDKFYWKRTA